MITLNNVMKANAASCIVFGLIFLLAPTTVSTFLSDEAPAPAIVLLVLGGALSINGLHLFWASLKSEPSTPLVLYFSIGDFIWVFASISLWLLGTWITSIQGVTASLLVAAMVAAFGILQIIKRKEIGGHECREST